jgi:hypothetical protein
MARSQTLSVNLDAPFEKVWAFLSDPRNLHLWTIDFALAQPQLKSSDIFVLQTPRGTLDLFVKADQASGVIDFHFGTGGKFRIAPTRLLRNGENECIYIFTQFEPPEAPPGLFEKLVENVRKEFEILSTRFRQR